MTAWSANWPTARAPPWCSPSTTCRPRPATRSPSSRTTPWPEAEREGEAYAAELRQAGVPVTAVRFQHDLVMLNALRGTTPPRTP